MCWSAIFDSEQSECELYDGPLVLEMMEGVPTQLPLISLVCDAVSLTNVFSSSHKKTAVRTSAADFNPLYYIP